MTEIDALKYELEESRNAFDRLYKRHIELLKQQGRLEKENKELKEENEQLKDALNQRTDQCDKYYKENEQLKQQRIYLLRLIENNIEIYENINTNVEFHQGEIQGKLTLLYNLREVMLND